MEIILIYLLISQSVPELAKRDKLLNNGRYLITRTERLKKNLRYKIPEYYCPQCKTQSQALANTEITKIAVFLWYYKPFLISMPTHCSSTAEVSFWKAGCALIYKVVLITQ